VEGGLTRLISEIRRGHRAGEAEYLGSLLSAFNFNILEHKYLKIVNKV
jgi:hypothetical protein